MISDHGGNLFAVARKHGWDWREIADFSASINPLGPSPTVLETVRSEIPRIAHYPEPESWPLTEAVAQVWEVSPDCVLLGNGATELIHFLARVGEFEGVTLGLPVFSEFQRAFPNAAKAILPEIAENSSLLVVTQPLNPTGQLLNLDRWLSSARPMLVDESFLQFTGHASSSRWIEQRPQLYILCSLTKFYALPGLRIGALLASPDAIRRLRRRREPWQVNALAERAALAALSDRDHAQRTVEFVRSEREWLREKLAELAGVVPQHSSANYLLCSLTYAASRLVPYLFVRKILVRDCSGWPGVRHRHAVRIAVRTRVENERLLDAWRSFPCD
jgi:threonine-phosphate decarboxylase